MKNKTKGNEPNLVNQHKYKTEQISPLQLSWSSILATLGSFLNCLKPVKKKALNRQAMVFQLDILCQNKKKS